MFKKILQILILFSVFLSTFLFALPSFAASDFQITYDHLFTLPQGKDYVSVEEKVKYEVLNNGYRYKPGIIQTFFLGDFGEEGDKKERSFEIKSISVTNEYGEKVAYTKTEQKDGILIKATVPKEVNASSPYTLKLRYNTHNLVNISGNITNVYIPSLAKDTPFTEHGAMGTETTYRYNTKLTVPKSLPLPSYIQPSSLVFSKSGDNYIFTISAKNRVGHMGWIQFGSSQYYKFKIVQNASKTDNITPEKISNILPLTSTNVYKLAIPREYEETDQETLISSITPEPKLIERDNEGNLIATFEVPANSAEEISIEGYISLKKNTKEIKDISLTEYSQRITNLPNYTQYIQPDQYWESDSELVRKIAQENLTGQKNILDLIEKDYQYIIDKFEYSFEKIENGNVRIGALQALMGGQTICMEYSDSLVALLRAQGVPARVAIGYGNDPTGIENSIGDTTLKEQTIGHQWVQVWVPDYGWMSVDPTWGESNRKYIGTDLDHILWYTIGNSQQSVTETALYSADQISNNQLENYKVYIQAIDKEEFDGIKNVKGIDDVILDYSEEMSPIDFYLKTTLLGRILIYTLPIITVLTVTSVIVGIIAKIFKRKNKVVTNQ